MTDLVKTSHDRIFNVKQAAAQQQLLFEPPGMAFHSAVETWFEKSLGQPTRCQQHAWSTIQENHNVLITAPTGSGKTLAAFLSCINKLVVESQARGCLDDRTRIVYISPLRALSNDIEKNLQDPLEGISRELDRSGLPGHGITTAVRTGDTSAWERQKINRKPPHILVTTPESLYILLTSVSGRNLLSTVGTVIVDEIHALIDSKRGAHLALSIQRLVALVGTPVQRIGLSATVKDKKRVTEFLCNNYSCKIVDSGSQRERDLQLCLPDSALTAVMSAEVWSQIYDMLVELVAGHRTTLVFVNTRRLAERLSQQLTQRMDESSVSTHHGSLSRAHRLDAENRLKNGQLKVLVATASLELGIDIGDVDLVCQIGSPGSISTFLQRVGRSGHGVNRMPKGRLFPTTLEELVESVALFEAVSSDQLDTLIHIKKPFDVLAQQIIAEVSAREWRLDELYACFTEACSFRDLSRKEFDAVINMLVQGFTNRRGSRFAFLHLDAVNGIVRARRSARLTALTNGGAIPELFDYNVILVPDNFRIGSVNEDFAFESMAGDVFQLGNTSYRILKVEIGKVYVEDARGQPPSIPFWFGEAPGRSPELCESVSNVMQFCEDVFEGNSSDPAGCIKKRYCLDDHTTMQLHDYLYSAYRALGALPKLDTVIFERFFDENDDMHLVIHSVHGSSINRAWGLALRKRFCRKFNFELQAAALENSIILSLGATHSFPLEEVKSYLSSASVKDVVIQAMLDAPLFNTHWRWVCNIGLAVKRYNGGKRIAPQIQRNNAEDLAAQVFPDQLACLENIAGEREIPDHPLVDQAINDCIHEVMNVDGLINVLDCIESERIKLLFKDMSAPSVLSQSIINARPYAFLDDTPAEERRTLALQSAVYGSAPDMQQYGLIPGFAIDKLRHECMPLVRNAEELHDALYVFGLLSEDQLNHFPQIHEYLEELRQQGRLFKLNLNQHGCAYSAAEWRLLMGMVYPEQVPADQQVINSNFFKNADDREQALVELVRSQLELSSPITQTQLAAQLGLSEADIYAALLRLQHEGFVMQGEIINDGQIHWCERRLLARLHRYALSQARESIRPVSKDAFVRFMIDWHHLSAHTRCRGINAYTAILEKLQGYAIPLNKWRELLAARVEGFSLSEFETLFLAGQLVWHRPRIASKNDSRVSGLKKNSLIMIYTREYAKKLSVNRASDCRPGLSSTAAHVYETLSESGSVFYDELLESTGLLGSQLEAALSELANAGMVISDSFQALLKLVNGGRQKRKMARRIGRVQPFAGRWSAVRQADQQPEHDEAAYSDDYLITVCMMLLKRYGVIFYSILQRESSLPPWRSLRYMLKRLEARGEIAGGRFVSGVSGEQFADKQAIALLRKSKSDMPLGIHALDAVDPVNISQILALGEPIPVTSKGKFIFKQGRFSSVQVRPGDDRKC